MDIEAILCWHPLKSCIEPVQILQVVDRTKIITKLIIQESLRVRLLADNLRLQDLV